MQVNARRATAILLVLREIMFLGFPLLFDILHVFSSVASLLIGVLTLLCEEKMQPDIISGESSGGKHLKLFLEVTPPNVHVVPKVLGREIYPTKISWNLENQNSTRNPQVK